MILSYIVSKLGHFLETQCISFCKTELCQFLSALIVLYCIVKEKQRQGGGIIGLRGSGPSLNQCGCLFVDYM